MDVEGLAQMPQGCVCGGGVCVFGRELNTAQKVSLLGASHRVMLKGYFWVHTQESPQESNLAWP